MILKGVRRLLLLLLLLLLLSFIIIILNNINDIYRIWSLIKYGSYALSLIYLSSFPPYAWN